MLHRLLPFATLALAAVIGIGPIDPKVNKAVDSILLIVQNELHHAVNEAVFAVATNDEDLVAEVEQIKTEAEFAEVQGNDSKEENDENSDDEYSLKKRWFYPYRRIWPYYYPVYPYYPYYPWGGYYFKVRKDIKQAIEGKIIKGFKTVALQIVNTEYTKFLNDHDDEAHLDATQERLTLAWEKYAAYQQKNTAISSWISLLEQKLSRTSSNEKTMELEEILKRSLVNVTDVFNSDQMDLPLSELYYPSEAVDEIEYV